jgi:hypothetical protein
MIWRCTPNGDFSVRSAYHLEMKVKMRLKAGGSCVKSNKEVWKRCWSLDVPNAVKMFLWRALNNSLPTKVNMFYRGVVDNKACPICEREDETVEHILWSCSSANDVWGCGIRKLQKSQCVIFEEITAKYDDSVVEFFAVVARRIWMRRNATVHGVAFVDPNQLISQARVALEDYKQANVKASGVTRSEDDQLMGK